MDLYLLGESLAYALIKLANVGQSCPVLLVGHCVGGLVLKQDIFSRFRIGERSTSTLIVEEASARFESEEFSILPGEDHFSICRPKSKHSNSFLRLLTFVDQVMQIEEIGEQIFYRTLPYTRSFVDMSGRVKNIIQHLQLDQANTSRLALVGMSGIGKTTLAKEVFISIKSRFDFVCFVEDVSDKLKSRELPELVAMHLFHSNGGTAYLQGGAAHSVWYLLKGRKVLLILDGVEDMKDINLLLDLDWCSEGSRLIITTTYPWTFGRCGFCDGLPLTVVVLGGHLSTIKEEYKWEAVLRILERAESIDDDQEKLMRKLRVSFDRLNETAQMIFLDLTLFDGYDLAVLVAAWENKFSPGEVEFSLEYLTRKSLLICDVSCWFQAEQCTDLKVSRSSKVKVHRQLRELGRSILKPPNKPIELWRGVWKRQDVEKLLTHEGKKSQVELISLERNHTSHRLQVDWDRIGRSGKLRFLQLKDVNFVGSCNIRFPSDLSLVHLINCSRESVNKLWERVTESTSWPLRGRDIEGLKKLAVLLLENCRSVRLPKNFHGLQNLKVLRIAAKDLTRLPPLFGHLPSLQSLFLNCPNLQQLPPSFLHLPELRELELIGCSSLNSLPVLVDGSSSPRFAFAPLANLTDLCIDGASSLTELPDSFGQLKSLQRLEIMQCHALKKLPEGFGDLQQLESLKIVGCKELSEMRSVEVPTRVHRSAEDVT
ncbi:hypothetical protein R1sor_002050 [Riccia sorocarpa]|uniref:NB-ARC domain-containing protein n=1 Tax=Riccia sorocarpa TaxID=122646 RepID=A0ABD3GY24_9MARC